MDEDFYLTLPSNSSMNYFKDNKISNFTTKLPRRIMLDPYERWEVALVDFTYPKTWSNVHSHPINIIKKKAIGSSTDKKETVEIIETNVRTDKINFADVTSFVNYLNHKLSSIPNFTKIPNLKVNSNTGLIKLNHGIKEGRKYFPQFHPHIQEMLGLPTTYSPSLLSQEKIEAKHPYDLQAGYHVMMLYTDIIEETVVGDAYANLLRVVEVDESIPWGQHVSVHYSVPQYKNLNRYEFETIQVFIKNDSGEFMPFEIGRSIVQLHFRKK